MAVATLRVFVEGGGGVIRLDFSVKPLNNLKSIFLFGRYGGGGGRSLNCYDPPPNHPPFYALTVSRVQHTRPVEYTWYICFENIVRPKSLCGSENHMFRIRKCTRPCTNRENMRASLRGKGFDRHEGLHCRLVSECKCSNDLLAQTYTVPQMFGKHTRMVILRDDEFRRRTSGESGHPLVATSFLNGLVVNLL